MDDKNSIEMETDRGLRVRLDTKRPHTFNIPYCEGEHCERHPLVPRVRETEDKHTYELGYKCLRCLNFSIASVDTDLFQWLFCAVTYNKLLGLVEPKKATTLGEAIKDMKELQNDS